MDVKKTIKDTLVQLLKVTPEELQDDAKLNEGIGVDSTEMVEFVIVLEKAFGKKFPEITKFSTINEIEKVIQGKLSA
ncbi:MAG: acyl carrier protein [Candidatus Omnitrophica bacterium]|nr:acyl carrier protein [Candidatus Omnitrophota bacterium]MDD5654574.1 acyl carrier protein [Candidatus Omnitrophota bacterium]